MRLLAGFLYPFFTFGTLLAFNKSDWKFWQPENVIQFTKGDM
jgi:hypothetical protein